MPSKSTKKEPLAKAIEATFKVTLPVRYRDFLDGEYRKYNELFVPDLPGISGKRQVVFDSPRLTTVFQVQGVKVGTVLPLAVLKDNPELLTIDIGQPSCPVGLWDEGTFLQFLPSLDALLASLLRKGEDSPRERLEDAVKKCEALRERDKEPEAVRVLDAAIGDLTPEAASPRLRAALGQAFNARGSAQLYLKKTEQGIADLEASVACGKSMANYSLLVLCEHYLKVRDVPKVVETAQRLDKSEWGKDTHTFFWCKLYGAIGALLSGDEARAKSTLKALAKELRSERELLQQGRGELQEVGANAKVIALLGR